MKTLTRIDLVRLYCESQDAEPIDILCILTEQTKRYKPDGFMLLRCQMLDSHFLGSRTILPFGPNNTFKTVPDHPISPRGLASDMSTVEAVTYIDKINGREEDGSD